MEGELVSITITVSEALTVITKHQHQLPTIAMNPSLISITHGLHLFFVSTKLMITKERLAKADIKIQFCQINNFY